MDNVDHTTLMQKWRAHWNTRDRIFNPPPETANKMGVTLFWVTNVALLYTTLNVSAADDDKVRLGISCFWWRVIAWFLCFQTSFNWCLTAMKSLSEATSARMRRAFERRGIVSPCSELDGSLQGQAAQHHQLTEFRTCPVCLLLAPPRSHHCKICNRCVLKRDHHCFFTASCVGFNNQRYFVVFAFYVAISCTVAAFLLARHLASTGLTVSAWYDLFRFTPLVAVVQWFLGHVSGHQLLQLSLLSIAIIFTAVGLHFFVWQVNLIIQGQTTYEVRKGIHRYRLNVSSNLRVVFGPYWILNFLWPLRTLPDGDGIFWQTQKTVKGT